MKVRNEIERAVRYEVGRQKELGRGSSPTCWCSLCEADVQALALTILPPQYTTVFSRDLDGEGEVAGAVQKAVFTAMKQVSRRPKHKRSLPETRPSRVKVVNYNYDAGVSQVASLSRRLGKSCGCPICQADTLAYALNRYPPKYGVLHFGSTKLPDYQLDFIRHELGLIISHAAGVVSSRPRHQPATAL